MEYLFRVFTEIRLQHLKLTDPPKYREQVTVHHLSEALRFFTKSIEKETIIQSEMIAKKERLKKRYLRLAEQMKHVIFTHIQEHAQEHPEYVANPLLAAKEIHTWFTKEELMMRTKALSTKQRYDMCLLMLNRKDTFIQALIRNQKTYTRALEECETTIQENITLDGLSQIPNIDFEQFAKRTNSSMMKFMDLRSELQMQLQMGKEEYNVIQKEEMEGDHSLAMVHQEETKEETELDVYMKSLLQSSIQEMSQAPAQMEGEEWEEEEEEDFEVNEEMEDYDPRVYAETYPESDDEEEMNPPVYPSRASSYSKRMQAA